MVVEFHGKQVAYRAGGAAFVIGGTVNHPGNPGVDNGTGAHGTGLQSYIEGAFPQPPAA